MQLCKLQPCTKKYRPYTANTTGVNDQKKNTDYPISDPLIPVSLQIFKVRCKQKKGLLRKEYSSLTSCNRNIWPFTAQKFSKLQQII
jgi:hypothetical protein